VVSGGANYWSAQSIGCPQWRRAQSSGESCLDMIIFQVRLNSAVRCRTAKQMLNGTENIVGEENMGVGDRHWKSRGSAAEIFVKHQSVKSWL
jgi:hypothetical protein